jgi:hypothetical protein
MLCIDLINPAVSSDVEFSKDVGSATEVGGPEANCLRPTNSPKGRGFALDRLM